MAGSRYLRGTQTTPTQEAELQTAVVRRGDLVISATGSGTLTAPEKDLGFTGSGDMRVTAVNVKAGDLVQQGEVLAQVDSTQTKQDYEEAQRAYAELTSISAQAAALRTVADAQTQVQRAKGTLEYLISPEVMYWETQITEGEDKLTAARTEVQKALGEAAAKAAADKAAAFLDFAQDKLVEAKKTYLDEYVPATFGIKDDLDVDTYNVPSDLEIRKAHLAVTDAEKTLADSQELYDALKNGTIPEDTTNAALLQIKKAQEQMKDAQANLDGSRIVAPYSGTVMSVSVTGGDVVSGDSSSTTSEANAAVSADPFAVLLNSGSDATTPSSSDETLSASGVIVLADTSEPYLEVNWNESDWPLLKVGNEVQITFDDRQDQVYSGKNHGDRPAAVHQFRIDDHPRGGLAGQPVRRAGAAGRGERVGGGHRATRRECDPGAGRGAAQDGLGPDDGVCGAEWKGGAAAGGGGAEQRHLRRDQIRAAGG